ncbi:MAG: hypothetical protein UV63_C0046G0010 [Microgenomates group bacterium GW2011_GWC1_43_11]|uniref:AAA+ ATPase domain-containing protein n=2 Tax=Candidatus Gottesmaniibacteriota TaxID=1752720 RepID=A0A0G1IR42_9BACT|nr:MAG: hypothetical protein UV63_C0046G0010 [Microgenomates group bacterium GW2011_GWC1_43_11]KKT34601.1 MAG: hypothetical protein UW22_C0070G0009 [Candidatus Gottesmanbacteria bacterium GW2011_GWB1_44_11c]KKT61438.1 MAG: hypothetical protein UW52_C0003G0001 [Candidatus Gottesmanbacteria bacterium GW2011_GWA1_44_24b]
MLTRWYQNLDDYIKPNKVLVLYGPRQVGKTTLVTSYLASTQFKYRLDSGDNVSLHDVLGSQRFDSILPYVNGLELLVLDEAQRIPNIGMALKIIVDQVPDIRVIVTGSASFELAGQIGEPLTGRKQTLILYPMAQMELKKYHSPYELTEHLFEYLIFGGYPQVITASTKEEKRVLLTEILNSYLLKDILELQEVKGSKVLLDLLRLLAFQVGNEVSLSELGTIVGLDYKTVARYLDIFEKAFILFELRGYSRNLRTEIRKKSKYYFLDNGIRNALINNFNDISVRNDIGILWENFCVIERMKYQSYTPLYANNYFWRTWDQKEVDWIEEREGKIYGYEFTYSGKKKSPKTWLETYKEATFTVINRENYLPFITKN